MEKAKKLHAINETNRVLYTEAAHAIKELQTYIGKKIVNADGSRPKSFKFEFSGAKPKGYKEDYAYLHRIHLDIKYGSVWLKVSCRFQDGVQGCCFYESKSIYLGTVSDQKLTSLVDETPEYSKITLTRQIDVAARIQKLEKELSTLRLEYVFDK